MNEWILATPHFQLSVVLISSPIALAVAQFGMLSPHDRFLLLSANNMGEESSDDVAHGAAVIR
jgi:hypothetical protein